MENEVFERDYSDLIPINLTPQFQRDLSILKQAAESGIIRKYEEAVNALPKCIVPREKAAYDNLLIQLNEFAMAARGKILGIVNYEKWEATIQLTAPVFRFVDPEGILLLANIALSAEKVTVSVNQEGMIVLNLEIEYFQNIGDNEAIMDELLERDDALMDSIISTWFNPDNDDSHSPEYDL